ncbi:hypothetical protein QGM71_01155 [Virgibacillus sp. C22-A2]|uniref:Uncharacterized protein n=1 Tax=Virgibacillus tibetensis TaxID=3042313 RepID=A0ABU6KB14_9BACI|nr:hypothetical protein [Virgibacillus sp. C22-A2]
MSDFKAIRMIYKTQVEHGLKEITLNKLMFEKLLNQAERVEELEYRHKVLLYEVRNKGELELQNQRHKQALELIISDTHYDGSLEYISPIHVIRKRAEKALGGNA